MSGPKAGWYDDPNMANTSRYWDGETWTDHRQEKTPAAPPASAVTHPDKPSAGTLGAGYLFALLMPIIGLLIGLVLLTKRGNDGIIIIVMSVIAFFVWYAILTSNTV